MDPVTQSIVTSVIVGFFVSLIAGLYLAFMTERPRWQKIAVTGSIFIILTAILYLIIFPPPFETVPKLEGSGDQANLSLVNNNLVPDPDFKNSIETAKGDVIPGSQSPLPNTKVKPGTSVSFTISLGTDIVTVPELSGSQALAEQVLLNNNLVPDPNVKNSLEIAKGNVIPGSQSPLPNTKVKSGTHVYFEISDGPLKDRSVSLVSPKSGEKMKLLPDATGIYTGGVSGISSGIAQSDSELLLWVHPVKPASNIPGWYLQRSPNGVGTIGNDGTWSGIVQIGDPMWPPHDGDVFDLSVTIVESSNASQLMGLSGVVVRNQPVGIPSDKATGIVVTL